MSITTTKLGSLEYLTAAGISVPHCFTTRRGGVSGGYLDSLNIGLHRGDEPRNVEENYRILANTIGFDLQNVVLAHQTHSDIVRKVGREDCAGIDSWDYPQCDGLVTNQPGVALVVFTADCTPILLHDPVTGAVGAVHAGWRGTASGIAAKAVEKMVHCFGCNPADIRAAIGPNLSKCCFETGEDVPQAMYAALGGDAEPFICPMGDKFRVDLKGINRMWLEKAGVRRIEVSGECTMCDPEKFWSHRVTRGIRGSQGAIIVCKEGSR